MNGDLRGKLEMAVRQVCGSRLQPRHQTILTNSALAADVLDFQLPDKLLNRRMKVHAHLSNVAHVPLGM
jgi:hypothetical protein